jgi:threonyl-tRNA synthetase
MLQRIYGTAFFKEKELEEHLDRLEEAKKRDHRVLGKQLDLFTVDPGWARGSSSGSPPAPSSATRSRSTRRS